MPQFIRVILALLATGCASAYYLAGSIELAPAPAALGYEEFRTDRNLLERDATPADDGRSSDIAAAYAAYLSAWTPDPDRPEIARAISPIKSRLHRFYETIGDSLPTPRAKALAKAWRHPGNRTRAGMLLFAASTGAAIVVLYLLASWLKGLART